MENKDSNFNFSLYLMDNNESTNLTWNWILDEFGQESILVDYRPRSIVLISHNDLYYALTFGHSYYHINVNADINWAFDFAQRVNYNSIKSLEVNIPNSMINKRINSYIDYSYLDIGSGEALSKLDAYLTSDNNSSPITDRVNIGNSIKVTLKENNLNHVAMVIEYINFTIENENIKTKIPRFKQVNDENKIINWEKILEDYLMGNSDKEINFHLDFNNYFNQDSSNISLNWIDKFEYRLSDFKKEVNSLEFYELKDFLKNIDNDKIDNVLEDLTIIFNFESEFSIPLKQLLFFDYLDENVLLIDGIWYEYNQDYLDYLKESMDEIKIDDGDLYPFKNTEYYNFLKEKGKCLNCSEEEFMENKYKEYAQEGDFNEYLSVKKDFTLLDKRNDFFEGHIVEIADLYKENTIYAVKIGNINKMVYVIDQSINGLKFIHDKKTNKLDKNDLLNVCIWIILDRKTKIKSLNDIRSIIFKNKLDNWKKEVRLMGYTPIVKISYKEKK